MKFEYLGAAALAISFRVNTTAVKVSRNVTLSAKLGTVLLRAYLTVTP